MTFLNPAILIGLIAASIPVIIHLLNLKKLKNVEFSTLMFLKELQKNKIRKIKIKQWLLLLLRVLIIVFIVLSFARPTLKGVSIAGITSAAKTTSVFLIDNTFSMSVIDQNGSFLNQAKNLSDKIISLHQQGDEAFVHFIADDTTYQITSLSSDFTNSLKDNNISIITPDFKKHLISAAELVNKSKNFNREIFVFSDFQKNLIKDEKEKSNLSELFNNRVKVYFIPFRKDEIFNLSIDDVKPENQIIQKGSTLSFIVSITNHSKQNLQNRVLSLFINEKRVAQRSFNINSNETQKVNIETTLNDDGMLNIITEIETDDIEYDNRFYLSLNIPEKISALIVNENTNNDFLKIALQTLPKDKLSVEEKNSLQSSSLSLNSYDVIILFVNDYPNISQLINYIEQGGSVIIVPPNKINFSNFNNFVNKLGLGKFDNFISKDNKVKLQFDKVDYEHPVFKDLFLTNQNRKVDSPIFSQFLKNTSSIGTPIITLSDNSVFLLENKIGKGKVLLFNSSFDLDWTDLPLKSIFAPLVVKSIFYLSQKDFSSNIIKAGEEFILNISKFNSPRILVKRPDYTEDYFNLNEIELDVLRYNKTNIAGIYQIISNDKIITSFSVNHNKTESEQEYLSIEDFEKFLESMQFEGELVEIKPGENPIERINQSRFGTELWKFFVLLAIITALMEMMISRNIKKEVQSITN
ncbi:MAG: BatA domain-containing protein [Ignavibacterium sp.]|nr:BatA domain-containing protein [Ignavibacterium sp.]MCX7612022.1 BatA domain-containing protein [Ignavibacterium sp.]MDW8375382.1 BatA domain-containing protein [Ignavibacteriales bacterium]